ncbi:PadR family transcriptional regulator [Pararhizobium haloflavum]|uniref:PadR family transcriptional regulator n=1 Tax=Pararhizobium haloflavum TaxID=2037914 RepID=UPI000C19C3ED|nr:PadR family transcriptional regulator [Pararhizobium haloflavum]
MNIRTLCLTILNFGDATGYEIKKMATESRFSYFIDASYGSIYPALTRLEKDGCVTAREEREAGKPARKVYSITEKGHGELCDWLSSPPKPDVFKSEFLLIAMCADMLDEETLTRAIDVRVKQLEAELTQIREASTCTEHAGTNWIADYGKACMSFNLDYLKQRRNELQALARDTSQSAQAAE